MGDLARGWAIVSEHWHGHGAAWIAMMVVLAGGWMSIWIAISTERRKKKDGDDGRLTPKPRAPLPRSDQGFR